MMKKIGFYLSMVAMIFVVSCTTVEPGHRGVEVSWGGEVNSNTVYPEGLQWGIHWLVDDMIEYDVRERTMVEHFTFNDANNMSTGVEFALDFRYSPTQVNTLHSNITDVMTKITKTLKSSGKEVVPQYTASQLNLTKRQEAEDKLNDILSEELPEFYIDFVRIQVTDVDIPDKIAKAAEATATQIERNDLALKKVVEAKNNFEAAEYDAKTKAVLSAPAMLELQRVENDRLMWEGFFKHGKSPYGNNNMFGVSSGVGIFKNQQ